MIDSLDWKSYKWVGDRLGGELAVRRSQIRVGDGQRKGDLKGEEAGRGGEKGSGAEAG